MVSTPLKNVNQWEGLSHILWKMKVMFETTNQMMFLRMFEGPTSHSFPIETEGLIQDVATNGLDRLIHLEPPCFLAQKTSKLIEVYNRKHPETHLDVSGCFYHHIIGVSKCFMMFLLVSTIKYRAFLSRHAIPSSNSTKPMTKWSTMGIWPTRKRVKPYFAYNNLMLRCC